MSTDFAAARLNMVESQIRTADVTDLPLQDALRVVARETLVPTTKAFLAYADAEVEYAPGRWLLRPRDVGKLLQYLKPRSGETALAIAAPYAAAVLEAMGLTVTRLDGEDLKTPAGGGYDVIICEGAVTAAPAAWAQALALGGRLGVVERNGPVGQATLYVRTEDGLGRRTVFDATPPVLAGFLAEPGFAF
ncbi:MAG: protein-L-isoaspartate O-methyltransferase [bacterium]|nr:protein-L-isoaspartate O-methyltransferase [bacterium]